MPRLNISSSTLTSQNQGGGSSKAGSPSTIGLGRFSKNSIKKRASACKCSTKSSCTTIGTFFFINGDYYKDNLYSLFGIIQSPPPNFVVTGAVFTNDVTDIKVGCTLIHNNIEYTILQIVNGFYSLDKDFPRVGRNTVVKCCSYNNF